MQKQEMKLKDKAEAKEKLVPHCQTMTMLCFLVSVWITMLKNSMLFSRAPFHGTLPSFMSWLSSSVKLWRRESFSNEKPNFE